MDVSEAKARTMLIADDDLTVLRVLADRCAKMGFTVETAADGIQALIKARRNHPDIMIVDVNMPQLDGLTICARLLDPSCKPMEVVVITGSSDPTTLERCESFGAFYGRKGPQFWSSIASALRELFPDMADGITKLERQWSAVEVRRRPRVLVVDDDPDVKTFLSSRLGKCGVDMLYAPNAVQGYRIACKEEPNVIISDYYIPNEDVLYFLSKLRSTPATASIPVFVLSGRRLDEVTEQNLRREICGHPGAARFFLKSGSTEELFTALQEFCGFDNNRLH